jgi:hypothetical protein
MKVSGFLMAIYLLMLSLIPCRDSKECESQIGVEQADHNGHEDGQKGCTPFCICACCPTQVYVTGLTVDNFTSLVFSEFSSEINAEIRSFISHAIWQPPRTV